MLPPRSRSSKRLQVLPHGLGDTEWRSPPMKQASPSPFAQGSGSFGLGLEVN